MTPFDLAWLAATVRLATPLALAATGELISERTGVLNVGLEGMMLAGAFFAYWVAAVSSSLWLGVLAGAIAGMVLALLMALLTQQLRANQIVVGIGLNILALGITNIVFETVFVGEQATLSVGTMERVAVPLLSTIPILGRVLFDQIPLVYLVYALVPATWFILNRTTWGLEVRAVGEAPEAVDAAGISVTLRRTQAILTAGALAGIAGAFLSVGQLGLFVKGMTAGRGFLALAAVIFGRWRPFGVLGACLVFGSADALQLRLQSEPHVPSEVWMVLTLGVASYFALMAARRGPSALGAWRVAVGLVAMGVGLTLYFSSPEWNIPSALWLAVPPVLALAALAGVVLRAESPRKLGVPYVRKSELE